jgi:3-dehydrosphinganine reductase
MGFYSGRKVLVVGASEGIGREAALELARLGAEVVVAARRPAPLVELVAAMKALRPDGTFGSVPIDVTDRAQVRAAVPVVLAALGGAVDTLILAVGGARPGYVHELDDAAFDAMVDLNYTGHANVVRAFLPAMMERRRGDICFVSSALGFMSMPGYSAYSASKFAVAGFAEALHVELAPHGIRTVLFYPGTTATPGLDRENATKPKAVWTMESDSAFSRTHKAPDVARSLLAAIERGRFENFPGLDVWFVWWMYKRLPGVSRWMAHQEWAKALKKVAAAPKA